MMTNIRTKAKQQQQELRVEKIAPITSVYEALTV